MIKWCVFGLYILTMWEEADRKGRGKILQNIFTCGPQHSQGFSMEGDGDGEGRFEHTHPLQIILLARRFS